MSLKTITGALITAAVITWAGLPYTIEELGKQEMKDVREAYIAENHPQAEQKVLEAIAPLRTQERWAILLSDPETCRPCRALETYLSTSEHELIPHITLKPYESDSLYAEGLALQTQVAMPGIIIVENGEAIAQYGGFNAKNKESVSAANPQREADPRKLLAKNTLDRLF